MRKKPINEWELYHFLDRLQLSLVCLKTCALTEKEHAFLDLKIKNIQDYLNNHEFGIAEEFPKTR